MLENQTPQAVFTAQLNNLAGDDAEYMSPAMLGLFKTYLESHRERLKNEQEQALGLLRDEDGDRLVDPIDIAQRQEETEREHTRSAQRREQLKRNEIALRLVSADDGEYGYCVDCGAEIGLPRMISQPASTRDVNCASIYETRMRQRTGGTVASLSMA